MQSPIANDRIKLSIYGQAGPQLVLKVLLQVSVRELHNIMIIPHEEGVIKEARDAEDEIIMSDSILRNILAHQLKKITAQYKLMGGFECCISDKSMYLSLLTWNYHHIKHLKYRSQNAQNIRSD